MYVRYDTETVHALDRYDHYREGAMLELAPFEVPGRAPDRMSATMSVTQIGDFTIELLAWKANSEVQVRRTIRQIRASDPECYQFTLSLDGGHREEQAGSQVIYSARDLAFYDLSLPQQSVHSMKPAGMRVLLCSIPKALVPISPDVVGPLAGRLLPKSLRGCSLITQFLVELASDVERLTDPALAEVLHDCMIGLIGERLDRPYGITVNSMALHVARIRNILRRHHGDMALDPSDIANLANISPRYLYKICRLAGGTPMQLLKQIRLDECRRSLEDPSQRERTINNILAAHGYRRQDQFTRDFKKQFGISAKRVRTAGSPR